MGIINEPERPKFTPEKHPFDVEGSKPLEVIADGISISKQQNEWLIDKVLEICRTLNQLERTDSSMRNELGEFKASVIAIQDENREEANSESRRLEGRVMLLEQNTETVEEANEMEKRVSALEKEKYIRIGITIALTGLIPLLWAAAIFLFRWASTLKVKGP